MIGGNNSLESRLLIPKVPVPPNNTFNLTFMSLYMTGHFRCYIPSFPQRER